MLDVLNLQTVFSSGNSKIYAVNGLSYSLKKGESIAIVGESGSGKTVGALSLVRLIPSPPGQIKSGSVEFEGTDILKLSRSQLMGVRGNDIAYVFQDPMTSLNPVLTIERQMTEALQLHKRMTRKQARDRAAELLTLVGLPNAEQRLDDYPHQFSGGQRQRIGIAMALSCEPSVLVADEPTTALDVTVQAQILELVKDLKKKLNMGVIWISHDLGVVAGLVDKVIVMYAGFAVETGDVASIFGDTCHPYTQALLRSLPNIEANRKVRLKPIEGGAPDLSKEPKSCPFAPRCPHAITRCREENPPLMEVAQGHFSACWRFEEIRGRGRAASDTPGQDVGTVRRPSLEAQGCMPLIEVKDLKRYYSTANGLVQAVDGVSFNVFKGETFGVVGESGCGKSSLGRTVLRLLAPTSGDVLFDGVAMSRMSRPELQRARRQMQMIFQDPFSSLNPHMTVEEIISEPLIVHGLGDAKSRRTLAHELLERVGLNSRFASRFPHQLSGGQAQRIGISRALAANPSFIVADEPIAALDVSVQAQVVNLLDDLQSELGLTYLFISHDLSMVRHISDRVAVMYLGRIVETGDRDQLYDRPLHPYTQALLSAIPIPDPERERERQRIVLRGSPPSPINPPSGCRFHPRCHLASAICKSVDPGLRNLGTENAPHIVACHHAEQAG